MAGVDDSSVEGGDTTDGHPRVSSALLLLALLCFFLPFATVSCDTPGGYGRAAQGGTTTYRGVDLVAGTKPQVTTNHLAPPAARRPDRLGVQPLLLGAALLIAAVLVAGLAISHHHRRRVVMAAGSALTAAMLVAGVVGAQRALAHHVSEQLAGRVHAKPASEYVNVGPGFGVCIVLLVIVLADNAGPALRARGRKRKESG